MVVRLIHFRWSQKYILATIGIVFLLFLNQRLSIFTKRVPSIQYGGAIFKSIRPLKLGRGVYIEYLGESDGYTGVNQFDVRDRTPRILILPYKNDARAKLRNLKCMKTCPVKCDVTYNTSDIESVDVVDFYLSALWTDNWNIGTKKTIKFPTYRRQDQVWVISNWEPPSNLFGDLRVLNGIFNWTDWYRTDATIQCPYGRYEEQNSSENADTEFELQDVRNIFKEKQNEIIGVISNCKDVSRRYRFVDELSKYITMDMYGKCYNKVCGDPSDYTTCENVMKTYKFYLALENTYCKDYVTEKYWGALTRDQIPIVNWDLTNINKTIPIPGSYISVHDFGSVLELAEHIKRVSANESLYNSYFDWKKKYKLKNPDCRSCAICKKLHERSRPQVIADFDGWVRDDVCEKVDRFNIKETADSSHQFWKHGI